MKKLISLLKATMSQDMSLFKIKSKNEVEQHDNIKMCKKYCRYVSMLGHLPILPRIYFDQFLNENDVDIIDIKLSSSCAIYGEEQLYCFTALIIYKDILEE